MHGPAPAPPPYRPPATGVVVLLRVVFVAATVASLGLLAWAAMLRAALVQRRPLGWWLFGADLAVLVGVCVLVLTYPETDWRTNLAVGALLLQMMGAVAYYLVVDVVTAPTRPVPPPGHGQGYGPAPVLAAHPAGPPPAAPAYGPPPAAPAYGPPPAPAPPYAQETRPYAAHAHPYAAADPYANNAKPAAHPYAPARPQPQPQPQPQPRRIDQVRAELDELSDYLRQEEQP
ncbi:hypothetical protein AB0D04_30635 [Streptomyces sp. NPDC048483]|uniref:hypothetical protein n=1 Tax=Streptomyces sp. NPDC048483 TaxID=3154927 RepID=UPI003441EC17